jgi:hypothetical protein
MRTNFKIVIHDGVTMIGQLDFKVLVQEGSLLKFVLVTGYRLLKASMGLRYKSFKVIDGLVVEFKNPFFFRLYVVLHGHANPISCTGLEVGVLIGVMTEKLIGKRR